MLAAIVLGAPLARLGSVWARGCVIAAILLALGLGIFAWRRQLRTAQSLRLALKRILLPADATVGSRAMRAYGLTQRAEAGVLVGSAALAREHFVRTVSRVPAAALLSSSARRARTWTIFGLAASFGALALALISPATVLEGLNILVARHGRAPVSMTWLTDVEISVQHPPYLRLDDRPLYYPMDAQLPEGSLLLVRGREVHAGRHLVLTDGIREAPFTPDGTGAVVGHWILDSSATLGVAARFGQVLIAEEHGLELLAIPDAVPEVRLQDAPKTLRLSEMDRLPLSYSASDDHGLRQIDLVLSSGGREDRRLLDQLDGHGRFQVGSYVLESRDRFIQESFLPVQVRVEARDNDERGGIHWGRSASITLLPGALGESEARRYQALRDSIGAFVDILGAVEQSRPERIVVRSQVESARKRLLNVADDNYAGLEFGPGMRAFIKGQAELLGRDPVGTVARMNRLKDVILALDVTAERLANRDAEHVSKRLGKVAAEIAIASRETRRVERYPDPKERLNGATFALGEGIQQLVKLGELGADLGGVATADVARLNLALAREDMTHAELIADHIAARLGRPNPSFGSAGHGGVEAGTSPIERIKEEASDADRKFDELAGELAELAEEHENQISEVEGALERAEAAVNADDRHGELASRAKALREAAKSLPRFGSDSNSAVGQAAIGREHAEAMADAMAQKSLDQALRQGKDALEAIKQSGRQSGADWLAPQALDVPLDVLKKELGKQLAFLEALNERLELTRRERARETLKDLAGRERELAQRATNLSARGRHSGASLPQSKLDSLNEASTLMQRAAEQLEISDGKAALRGQRNAQQLLEQSKVGRPAEELDAPPDRSARAGEGGSKHLDSKGTVPEKDDGERAKAFRQRVLDGLRQQYGGRLAPAVKRYAEELLQ